MPAFLSNAVSMFVTMQLLNAIDNLTVVSDALCGVVQTSEEQLGGYSPVAHGLASKEEEDVFLSVVSQTPSDGIVERAESPGRGGSGAEQEEDEELRMLLRGGDSTVSSLVLQRGEKWSKEKLRKWVRQRKRKKMSEFAEMRENRSSAGTRSLRSLPAPDDVSHGPGGVKVRDSTRSPNGGVLNHTMMFFTQVQTSPALREEKRQ